MVVSYLTCLVIAVDRALQRHRPSQSPHQQDGQEVEVQASEYVEALKAEAAQLKAELVRMEDEKRQLVARVRDLGGV